MGSAPRSREAEALLLPEDAPRIRITAGAGTASQKSWYLRRPVTLIGSRRDAFILLHGRAIAPAHCVIVNTGSAVLLKDLYTDAGTMLNDKTVDLAVLRDGDLVRVGKTPIQVAIHTFRRVAPPSGAAAPDPLKQPQPLCFRLPDGSSVGTVDEACAVVGRGERVAVRLDDESVSPVQALVFAVDGKPAIFGLSAESATLVNGRPAGLAPLGPGHRLQVGRIELALAGSDGDLVEAAPAGRAQDPAGADWGWGTPSSPPERTWGDSDLDEIERKLVLLRDDIAASWRRFNARQGETERRGDAAERRPARGEAEFFDRQDAALRGRLHDLTGYQEELAAREAELRAQRAALEADRARLEQQARELDEREKALELREG